VTSRTRSNASLLALPRTSVTTTVCVAGAEALAEVNVYVLESNGAFVSFFAEPLKPVSAMAGKSTEAMPAGSLAVLWTEKSPVAAGL
jgi:hypothetical protein